MDENDKTQYDQQRNGPAFRTPIKPKDYHKPFHDNLTPYFSSKLKAFASKIRNNNHNRFRVKELDGESRLVFWSEMKQVSEASKSKDSSTTARDSLTPHQIDNLTKKVKANMVRLERNNIEQRQRVEELLKSLGERVRNNRTLKMELKTLIMRNKKTSQTLNYFQFLQKSHNEQQFLMDLLNKTTINRKFELQSLQEYIEAIPFIGNILPSKQQQYLHIYTQLQAYSQRFNKLMEERTPFSMVNCMFLVGILNEQMHILILQRREKVEAKINPNSDRTNRAFKISQKLAKREVLIDLHITSIVSLRIFIAIYMHCRSLTIPNIAPLMNSLSYFSQELRKVYNFQLFQTYVVELFDRLRGMECRAESFCEVGQVNEETTLRKRLILVVEKSLFGLVREVLSIFQWNQRQYYIYLSPLTMIVELQMQGDSAYPQETSFSESNYLFLSAQK